MNISDRCLSPSVLRSVLYLFDFVQDVLTKPDIVKLNYKGLYFKITEIQIVVNLVSAHIVYTK